MTTDSQHLYADLRQRERLTASAARHLRAGQLRLLRGGHPLEPADVPTLLGGRRAPRWWSALQAGRLAPSRRAPVAVVRGRSERRPAAPADAAGGDREPECTSC